MAEGPGGNIRMNHIRLGKTSVMVSPLCLGGNPFGWGVKDEQTAFDILDAYVACGGNFIDTADVYTYWVPPHQGGESEKMIGRWMRSRGNRERIVLATKVGKLPTRQGLGGENIRVAVDECLDRLQTTYIDLLYTHADDEKVPLEETLRTLDALVKAGKVRHLGCSNFTAARIRQSLEVCRRDNLSEYIVVQPPYNLLDRGFEKDLAPLCTAEGLAICPYFSLAKGFLTGKYRVGGPTVASVREAKTGGPSGYLEDPRGLLVLEKLDALSQKHKTSCASIALAWLRRKGCIPIASVTSVDQLHEITPFSSLCLSDQDMAMLDSI